MKSYTGLTFDQIKQVIENSGFSFMGRVIDKSIFARDNEIIRCSLQEVLGLEEWYFEYSIDADLERVEHTTADVYRLINFRNNVRNFL